MHLLGCIPLSVLSLVSSVASSQVQWARPPTVQSTTLVDILNADEEYTLLLSLLQRTRLIPTLNKLNGSTFFAPTNDAVEHHSLTNGLWRDALTENGFSLFADNVQERLRQQLFYHLLNYTLPTLPTDSTPHVLETLHFPKPYVEPPTNEPPPSPPWMPLPQSTLGNKPQRLRIASRDEESWVGVNAFGEGGVKIVKEKAVADNGVVYGVSEVLELPLDLEQVVLQQPSLSYFRKVVTPSIQKLLNTTPELTLFMPVDSAWQMLDPLERLYLESEFATDDLNRIVNMHAVVERRVKWSDSFKPAVNFTSVEGTKLEIIVSDDKIKVSDAELVEPDIYASNGVLHLVSSLLIPPGALQLTPEKYLLALNCTSFISLIHSVNLTHLINDTETEYTILAPKDDVLSLFEDDGLPKKGTEELKKLLQYHFIPGKWLPKKLKNGMLLETVLQDVGLDGGRQVLDVEVDDDGKQAAVQRNVRFGGAGSIGDHLEINNTVIYFVSRPLEPPSDPLAMALPSLELSSFLAAIFSTSLAEMLKTTPRTTVLLPPNSAFKRLGSLVSDHLLAASSKSDLEHVIMHHIIDGVEYSQNLVEGSQRTFATLEGSDLQLERPGNGTVILSASGGWPSMKSELFPKNMLTNTGVIHQVSDLMIPRSVELNVGKLMKAAKATTMVSIVVKAGFDWILNGTAPPEGSQWEQEGLSGVSWTLLCPTDDAFKQLNLTSLFENVDHLREIVSQHLVFTPPSSSGSSEPFDLYNVINNNRPLPFDELGTYSTLLSPSSIYGDVVFKELEDKTAAGYMVGIKGARGTNGKADWARVLSWGRATTGGGTGGVIQIDRLLDPYHPLWWIAYGGPTVVGVGGIGLICLFFYGVRLVWNRDTTEATYEPVGGFGRDDDS